MSISSYSEKPIGVFDSGVGGLTVVAALRQLLPQEDIIYLGDTARVPYGGKSQEMVTRYSTEITDFLFKEDAKIVIVACNTASALAVSELKKNYSQPIQSVIEPGAIAAVNVTRNKIIGVIGTKATTASKAYHQAIKSIQPDLTIFSTACPLLAPLIEEGLLDDEITRAVLRRYLEPMLETGIDTLVLGCTHYPLLKKAIKEITGPGVTLVDSAENCARAVQSLLGKNRLITSKKTAGSLDVILTDSSTGFFHLVAEKLELEINSFRVETI
ncbi:MAG: glutamate racemase [Chthoniobacterales bacterium]